MRSIGGQPHRNKSFSYLDDFFPSPISFQNYFTFKKYLQHNQLRKDNKKEQRSFSIGYVLGSIARKKLKIAWACLNQKKSVRGDKIQKIEKDLRGKIISKKWRSTSADPYLRCSKVKLISQIYQKLHQKNHQIPTSPNRTPPQNNTSGLNSETKPFLQERQNHDPFLYNQKSSTNMNHQSSPLTTPSKVKFNYLNYQKKTQAISSPPLQYGILNKNHVCKNDEESKLVEKFETTVSWFTKGKSKKKMNIISTLPRGKNKISISRLK